jgi:chromosome segregation protein
MQGFKSFADPVSIEFDRGITCIVGPNGSGKSNISDALRWVLGEQSAKTLRGGRMDEVIFAGTDKKKSRGMAEVTLVIDNSDHSLPIDFSEVSVTRRMYRSGESEYFINHSQCRLKDIRELIMDTGIGVDGYSIIGQGKISEIISGRPESRREIFEEAAGIVRYKSRKAETERKLVSTSVDLDRVKDIINELEQRIEPLKEESQRADEYLQLKEKYRENEINVILKNIEQLESRNVILKRDCDSMDLQIAEGEKKRDDADRKIGEKKLQKEELERQDVEARSRLIQFNSELDEMRNSVNINKEKINSLKTNSTIYRDEMQRIKDKLHQEEVQLKQLQARSEQLNSQSEQISSEMSSVNAELEAATAAFRENTERFNYERDRLYEQSAEATSKAAGLAGLKQIRNNFEERLAALTEITPEPAYENDYNAALKEITALQYKYDEEKFRMDSLRSEKSEIDVKYASFSAAYESALQKLNEARTKKEMLEQLENSYEGYSYAVRFIMNESRLKGIYGTVGELIKVPTGYETAINAALGARVQNIVCNDDESAGAAIRLLRLKRVGRLTFLPAESIKASARRNDEGLSKEQGYIGIAADCVTFEPRYEKVMEYLLGGIVIVKDLQDALRISKKYTGFRYVTLDGEFISPAGAITGGSHKNNNADILERKNRLNKAETELYRLENETKSAENDMKKSAEGAAVCEKSLRESEERFNHLNIELIQLKNEANSLKDKLDEYKESAVRKERETARIQQELSHNAELYAKLEKEKNDADADVELHKNNAESLISENENVQKKIDELSSRMTSIRISMESVKNDILNVNDLTAGCRSRISELNSDYAAKETAEREAAYAQEMLQNEIISCGEQIKMSEAAYSGYNEALDMIKQARLRVENETEKLRMDRDSLEKSLFGMRTTQHDILSQMESSKNSAESLKNHIWDEFEISYLQALEKKKKIFDISEGMTESRRLKLAIKNMGDVNVSAISEYAAVRERHKFLSEQKKDLDESIASLRKVISDTDAKIRTAFKSSFDAVRINFRSTFKELFGGGKAELRIDGDADPLDADIEIIVQPPGKKLQNMNLMSGGEKTLTAIALMFAVLKTKPAPFCILDEVEAALDEANIERFAKYLESFEGIQFVLVTHQKVTMEHANVLYGVTMPEKGISKLLSLKLSDAADWEEKE